jgi:AcrR family transcriptional regulator
MSKAAVTKKNIIDQALGLFNTKGYRATSLSDITRATGLSKGAIYGNFPNKDAVAVAAFEHAIEAVTIQVSTCIKAQPNAPGKLKAILDYYEDYVHNPPISGGCPIINTAIEADDNHPLLRARVIRIMTMMKDAMKKILYRGVREKQLSDDFSVEDFATHFYASIKGAIILSRVEGDLESYREARRYLEKEIDRITIK